MDFAFGTGATSGDSLPPITPFTFSAPNPATPSHNNQAPHHATPSNLAHPVDVWSPSPHLYTSFTAPITPSMTPSNLPSTAQSMPGAAAGSLSTVTPLFVDTLAKEFNVDKQQRANMHVLCSLGSLGNGLPVADLATRLYLLAVIYGDKAERDRKEQEHGFTDLKALIHDLKIRLEETFKLTSDQTANIRGVAQDMMFDKHRYEFSHIHKDIMTRLKKEMVTQGLTNIFGQAAREKKLLTRVKRIASSVRNNFREDLLKSVTSGTSSTLEMFTYNCGMKFKQGGVGDRLEQSYTVHIALLRKCTMDNYVLASIAEAEDDPSTSDIENDERATVEDASRKRRRSDGSGKSAAGRIKKGEDFWGKVDKYFAAEFKKRGRDLAQGTWPEYIDEVIRLDDQRFGAVRAQSMGGIFSIGSGVPIAGESSGLAASSTISAVQPDTNRVIAQGADLERLLM
ncbi:hypothetical protein Hypma_004700 [Hypsizygus marmoreus]|uniref:Uncharacterized protein n=1 Tax=Hypsizygus marmoreus TaxID=39966 RepID=A0A369J673_HYPMA|nr:hypothetical protein Hypma_004700 [Hypsizygus marmoreus]